MIKSNTGILEEGNLMDEEAQILKVIVDAFVPEKKTRLRIIQFNIAA
jgi:hypothetical protein